MKNRQQPHSSGITQSLGATTVPIEKAIAQSTQGNEKTKIVDLDFVQAKVCSDEDCPYCHCKENE